MEGVWEEELRTGVCHTSWSAAHSPARYAGLCERKGNHEKRKKHLKMVLTFVALHSPSPRKQNILAVGDVQPGLEGGERLEPTNNITMQPQALTCHPHLANRIFSLSVMSNQGLKVGNVWTPSPKGVLNAT